MIKWFCDVCGNEIKAPDNPVLVRAYCCGKNRDHAEIGWGQESDIIDVFVHKTCADVLVIKIQAALKLNPVPHEIR